MRADVSAAAAEARMLVHHDRRWARLPGLARERETYEIALAGDPPAAGAPALRHVPRYDACSSVSSAAGCCAAESTVSLT